jgi:MinD-like ATPase involved in chromosome partitioning or flagellar assembly
VRTVLVTLIGPERTADLVVDADVPVSDLLPNLMAAGSAGGAGEDPGDWQLALMGREPVPTGRTLEEAGVLDGAVLVLRRAAGTEREAPVPITRGPAPAGSPLARTRTLLATPTRSPRRRPRLLTARPAGAPLSEGALAELERAVGVARLSRCVTIAVLSPKGGVGKTTVAIMLGELFCRLRQEVVLALDADGDYGSLGRVAPALGSAQGASARGGDPAIFEALAHGSVTFAELDRSLWVLPGGLRIVPSPRDPAAMVHADRETYARVIANLQRLAGVLVIDCGTGLGQPGVQAAVLAADQLVLVTDASGATASLVAEAMALLERAGRPVTVVANRLRRGRPGEEDLKRLDAVFPRASALVGIPDEPQAELALRGELELSRAPRALRASLLELAAVLAQGWQELGLDALSSTV